jgi:integrase
VGRCGWWFRSSSWGRGRSRGWVQAAFTSITRCRAAAGHPLARGTLKRVHATLRAALNYAVSLGVIEDNPARLVRLPPGRRPHAVVWTAPRLAWWHRTGTRPAVAVWTVGQTAQFLSWLRQTGEPLYPLFHLAAMLGLRRGELAGLQWGDIDAAAQVLVVSRQVRREPGGCLAVVRPKSEASNRVVALDRASLAVLRRLREQRIAAGARVEPATFLFPGYGDRPVDPDRLTKLFRWLNTASGLPPVRLHDLRHGAASLALAAGNDLKFVQALLGHASIVLTADTYTSVLEEHAHRGARATAELILVTEKRLARRLRRPVRRRRGTTSRARGTRQVTTRARGRKTAGRRVGSVSGTRSLLTTAR